MQHDAALDLLPAAALDAVAELERGAVAAHAGECADCRRQLADLLDVALLLPLALDPLAPPSALRERLAHAASGSLVTQQRRAGRRGRIMTTSRAAEG